MFAFYVIQRFDVTIKMNSKKISYIVLTGLMLTGSPALSDTAYYGELNLSLDALNADGKKSIRKLSSNSSILGLKGLKPLNENLKLIYKAEWGIDTGGESEDTLVFSKRNQGVGLISKYGAVIIGRYDTPFKVIGRKADLFWHNQLGQNRNITNPENWDLRAKNSINYQTPRKNGWQAALSIAKDADTSDNKDDLSLVSTNVFYKKRNYRFAVGVETHDFDLRKKQNALRLMADYRTKKLKLVGFYQHENNGDESDADVYGVGAAYAMGKSVFKGQLYSRDNESGKDANLFAVGYDRKLSKKTDVYVQFAHLSGGLRLGGVDHGESITPVSNGNSHGFSLGVRHKF